MPVATDVNTSYGIESQLGCLALLPLNHITFSWAGGFRQQCTACDVLWNGLDGSGCWLCDVPGERTVPKAGLR